MPPAGFEKATPESKRPQTHDLDRAATGIGLFLILLHLNTDVLTRFVTLCISLLPFLFRVSELQILASCSALPLYNLYCFPDTNYAGCVGRNRLTFAEAYR
jgi:hypothetical protein